MDTDVLVVGAGPAGLAVAACLKKQGVQPLVVDRGSAVGESWRRRYERLHLHTPRVQSALPGMRIPRSFGRWVSKDDMAEYLRQYAVHHGIEPRFSTEVQRLEPTDDGWTAVTSDGKVTARQVVVASGYNCTPVEPSWPGQDAFPGEVTHASRYSSPEPYRGREVLVVGPGNTGAEIAADLAESSAGRVWLAVRTPPNIVPRSLGPVPTTLLAISMEHAPARLADPLNRALQRIFVGDLTRHGLPAAPQGLVAQMRATGVTPTIDVGLIKELRAGRVTPVAAVDRFEGDEVVLSDGTRLAPDAVIAATGYTTGLLPVAGHLGVLDKQGRPLVRGRRTAPTTPGLRFVGLSNPLKGLLFQISLDARAVARAIARGAPAEAVSTPEADDATLVAAVRAATGDDRARLRAAISAVRRAAPALYTWRGGTSETPGVIQMQYPDYHPAVDELVVALGAANAVAVFDWMHWDGVGRYQEAMDVQGAPLADVVRLVTAIVRGERFSDGTIAAALDDGRLLAAAQRVLDG